MPQTKAGENLNLFEENQPESVPIGYTGVADLMRVGQAYPKPLTACNLPLSAINGSGHVAGRLGGDDGHEIAEHQ